MKHLLLTTIAAVVLVGCGPSVSIHDASNSGDIEVVKQYLDAGADVNAKEDYWGFTPLHLATREGHNEIVELLIAKGADVNAKDLYGDTLLDEAIKQKQTKTADLLRKNGGKTAKELKLKPTKPTHSTT